MSANPTIDRLVSRMNIDERVTLLAKIRENSTISEGPLYVPKKEDEKSQDSKLQYQKQPWFIRLICRLIGYFSGRGAAGVFENWLMLRAAREMEAQTPGIFDYGEGRLLNGFFLRLVELKDAARFFYNVLDTSINSDRGAFYSTLGSLEMRDVHVRLQAACDPKAVDELSKDADWQNLRKALFHSIDEILYSIPESVRDTMYYHARSIGHLRELSCFLFDRLILVFEARADGRECRVTSTVREKLTSLDGILYSLREPPALSLLESLFVYDLETRVGEAGFDVEGEMAALLERAEKALSTIRRFGGKVPLTRIIRLSTRNMGYLPAKTSGGEDWFHVYRVYWRQQAESMLEEHFADKNRREVASSFADFFGLEPKPLANAAHATNPDGFQFEEAFALSLLAAYHFGRFEIAEGVINTILAEGKFVNPQDCAVLTEALGDITSAVGQIRELDEKLAPGGEHGMRIAIARQEVESPAVKRRKMAFVRNEAAEEAMDIVLRYSDGAEKLASALEEIAGGTTGQSCLLNFAKLAGNNPPEFADGVSKAAGDLRMMVKLLEDSVMMEKEV